MNISAFSGQHGILLTVLQVIKSTMYAFVGSGTRHCLMYAPTRVRYELGVTLTQVKEKYNNAKQYTLLQSIN